MESATDMDHGSDLLETCSPGNNFQDRLQQWDGQDDSIGRQLWGSLEKSVVDASVKVQACLEEALMHPGKIERLLGDQLRQGPDNCHG